MRHKRKTIKLGRSQSQRDALLSNLATFLIEHGRIRTTVARAKAMRPFVEKLLTRAKKGTLHARRMILADLRMNRRAMFKLVDEIAPRSATRPGGYTRILKLGPRKIDSAPMAIIEWVDAPVPVEAVDVPEPTPAKKAAKKPAAPKAKAEAPAAEATPVEEKKPARKPRAKKTDEGKAE